MSNKYVLHKTNRQLMPSRNGTVRAASAAKTEPRRFGRKIAVVGMGYVGLPLALQFARSGADVVGLDIDSGKVNALNEGKSYIQHISTAAIVEQIKAAKFRASVDFAEIKALDTVIICVPTPLSKNREPDLSYILRTGENIAPCLQKGALVVLESTTYPGTTDTDLREVLEQGSGMKAGVDFHLAFSPEREDPGNPSSRVASIPKVIGGFTPACLEKAMALYSQAVERLVPVSSCRAAEATKLLENIFRSVNIALVNELKVVYGAMGIDVWEVIDAAKTKPFGFMPFYPGPGLGGHCIPIDPFYLTWKAREYGKHTRFIELAGEINTSMPEYVVNRLGEALNAAKKPLNGSRILVLGLAYKANVDDMRESSTFHLFDLLKARGAKVAYHDPHIPVIGPTREHSNWTGYKSIPWTRENVSSYDAIIIATAHEAVNYAELAKWSPCIIDTRNVMKTVAGPDSRIWKA